MKSLKKVIVILVLNTLKISRGKSILEPPLDVLHQTPSSIATPVANPGIRVFVQEFPQYQTLAQTKINQLPVPNISYLQGQNQQLYQVPSSTITASSSNTQSGNGLIVSGSSQGDVSSSFPGIGQFLESTKHGNGVYGGIIRPQFVLSTDGTLIQSPIKADASILNTLFSGQGVVTSFPNQVQYPTLGGESVSQSVKWTNTNVPTVRPLGASMIYTSGSTIGGSDTLAHNVAPVSPNPGLQTQVIQVPCTLHIPSPVPISVNPGISQISTNIPSSFIDNSPPTISILRPPSSLDTIKDFNYGSLPISLPTTTTHFLKSTHGPYVIDATTISKETKENSQSQDSTGVLVQNDDPSDLARNSLPKQYSTRPLYTAGGTSIAMAADSTPTRKQVQSPTSRPTRGKNPFFSVNKRKHFEFYSYF